MNEKICQRCGKTYISKSIITDDIKESLFKMVNVLNGKDKRITDFIDLCPECVNSFRTWLKCKD
jgi:hypothetical protein